MSAVVDGVTIAAVGAGVVFFLAGTLGMLRFPDPLARLHAITKADTLGLGLIVLGLLPRADHPLDAAKLVVLWLAALLASATMGQLAGRIAWREANAGPAAVPIGAASPASPAPPVSGIPGGETGS